MLQGNGLIARLSPECAVRSSFRNPAFRWRRGSFRKKADFLPTATHKADFEPDPEHNFFRDLLSDLFSLAFDFCVNIV